jgi:pantoate--beta-alanine ligase
MQVFEAISEIRQVRWRDPVATWGLVPTMGFLHEGHMSLVARAREENERVGVSIFVNPAQFNNPNDLTRYPRNTRRDLELLESAGADLVWMPEPDTVYPDGYQTYVDVEAITRPLEGASRGGHFRGVATVVSKLFNVFEPHRAYFGQKDAQQALTIKRMVDDLNFNLTVEVCDTIRESDGLALSSRNVRLSPQARAEAPCLYKGLEAAQTAFAQGHRDAEHLRSLVRDKVITSTTASLEYVSVADPQTLGELEHAKAGALVSVAADFGDVRLIDNCVLGD